MSFYDEVLIELVTAVGAALFVANLLALIRRRSPVPPTAGQGAGDLARAPLARTLVYMAIGFVVMAWGLASIVT